MKNRLTSCFLLNGRAFIALLIAFSVGFAHSANAQSIIDSLPGSIDAGRIKQENIQPAHIVDEDSKYEIPSTAPKIDIPEGAGDIHFTLEKVDIIGSTAFTSDDLGNIYEAYLGKEITLDMAYIFANAITERYRAAGYFLSMAHVPNQQIKDGIITINVVEGYVSKVLLDSELNKNRIVQAYISNLTSQKPLKASFLESFLLRLDDFPGYSFRSVLSPLEGGKSGEVKMTLVPSRKASSGSFTFDNSSSRYLGPNEFSANYSMSPLPAHQTNLSGISSSPSDKLMSGTIDHSVIISPSLKLNINTANTEAAPGFSLEPYKIRSQSSSLGLGVIYQWIRQRRENLSFKFSIDGKNSNSDILGAALTRDRIRAFKFNAIYDLYDRYSGYNILNLTISQGLNILGSSQTGDLNLSRARAKTYFTKAELSLTRQQGLTENWSMVASSSTQLSSGALYSSEEFGYGGVAFGRAYDSSDITGDRGISGSLELRYAGFADLQPVGLQPYTFIDTGRIWNKDPGQSRFASASSAGIGLRGFTRLGFTGNLGLAWPIGRDISTPIYGGGTGGPRVLLQISKDF